ncbi:MAG TPA: NAD(P)H-hydrate dehydratase [Dermatophilaceae bacterium]|nr:NAD(P)H-hydrate dehydratase [Dermatophilaceae bacterium]
MIEAWSVRDVYAAEAALMADLPEGELMARAVAGLVEVVRARLREVGGRGVVALVGPGNNGLDALYTVCRLAERGVACAAVLTAGRVDEGTVAGARAAGVAVLEGEDPGVEALVRGADVVLDGVLGIGGRGGLPGFARAWVDAVPEGAYVIAVDLPSGQDPSGEALDPDGVFADETVTFSCAKPVHLLPATERAVGRLTVVDIGLSMAAAPAVRRLTHDDAGALWPVPVAADDKYSRGVVGVVAGGEDYAGAAVLCVTAAVESGAGMVRYVGPPTPTGLVRAQVPEAVHGPGQVQAWVIGPGLDPTAEGEEAAAQLAVAREALDSDLPVLLDAGGLDLLLGPRRSGAPTLLTPHAGECARLLTRLRPGEVRRADVTAAPVRHARELARLASATVLLKGSTTLVVGPAADDPVWSQADAPPWLATAGSGDVLAGLAGTLLAAGLDPAPAGALAALVHGVAADRANPGGPVRALAVAAGIPATVAHLLRRG